MNLANRERASQDRIGTGPRHGRRCPGRGWGPPPGGFPLDPQGAAWPCGDLAGREHTRVIGEPVHFNHPVNSLHSSPSR